MLKKLHALLCCLIVSVAGCQSIPPSGVAVTMYTVSDNGVFFKKNSIWTHGTSDGDIQWISGPYQGLLFSITDPSPWVLLHRELHDASMQNIAKTVGFLEIAQTNDNNIQLNHSLILKDEQLWWVWQPQSLDLPVVYIPQDQWDHVVPVEALYPEPVNIIEIKSPDAQWEMFDGETLEPIHTDPNDVFMMKTPAEALGLEK